MRTKALASIALAIPFIAFATLASNNTDTPDVACTVSTSDTVPVGLKATVLKAKYTEMIGDSLVATFAPLSKITIFAVANSTMDSPPSVELTLDTQRAVPGKWGLVLKGERGECAGEVQVAPRKQPSVLSRGQ
ncbi:MAG TPA: hypothetical protein VJR92_02085 [Gemmatimonadaceae bacterium]|nr:hypothetical protein [Gemmatimonadaceae bacterium]